MSSRARKILILCPARPGTRYGNRITALRWQAILRGLGHRPLIANQLRRRASPCDVLVALHASHSAQAIAASKAEHPTLPVIVAITGTDLYRDGETRAVQTSLELADRVIVLHEAAVRELPQPHRGKTHVVFQSAEPLKITRPEKPRTNRVIVAGHLRSVKDPFRAAKAVRNLPKESKIAVDHYGRVIDAAMMRTAQAEMKKTSRYNWHGEIPRGELRRRLARCWMMVLSSRMEGGANVLSEAIVNHTPVLASRISGSFGLLGSSYEGYFDVGSTRQLRELLVECEQNPDFYARLRKQIAARSHLFTPAKELASWKNLLAGLKI